MKHIKVTIPPNIASIGALYRLVFRKVEKTRNHRFFDLLLFLAILMVGVTNLNTCGTRELREYAVVLDLQM